MKSYSELMAHKPTQRLSMNQYLPGVKGLPKTWNELIQRQVNKEAELIVADQPMPVIDNKELVRWVRARRPKRLSAGIYNFVKGMLP